VESPEGDPGTGIQKKCSGCRNPEAGQPGNGNAAGSHRQAADHSPDAAADTHAPRAQDGNNDTGANTATGNPAPTANATASQVPEPPPTTAEDRTEEPGTGTHSTGHGPLGNATRPEPGPPATDAANTNRVRTANTARPAGTEGG
jgi:hypothetical protein